jgi:DNA-binding NtrC family response regulator
MSTSTAGDGSQLYYNDSGSGQPVVFSHGYPTPAMDRSDGLPRRPRIPEEVVAHLLVIHEDPFTLEYFRVLFEKTETTLTTAQTAAEGLNLFTKKRPDVVIVDLRAGQSGMELLCRLHDLDPKVPVILVTGHGTPETAVEAIRLGAYDYIVKPLDPEPLRQLIESAVEMSRLMQLPAKVAAAGPAKETEDILVGECPKMQEVYKDIGRVAPHNVTVLIFGESGTGKELVARAVYRYSSRSDRPFLAMNCAAIPETLLESELFGHEKGSFTGADRKRIGKFEQCNGGTLFLDEIGDMTPLTQTKILRVLQEGQFERVGGNDTIKTDVRIIAATNRDLSKLIEEGRFRQDLYYRLNVYGIRLPPLRERAADLPVLVKHFLRRFSRELGKEVYRVTPEALELLLRYPWPGNVRELQSVLKQAILQATGNVVVRSGIPRPVLAGAGRCGSRSACSSGRSCGPTAGCRSSSPECPEAPGVPAVLTSRPLGCLDPEAFLRQRLGPDSRDLYAEFHRELDRLLLGRVLEYTGGNQLRAALLLGIARRTLRQKLQELGLHVMHAVQANERDLPRVSLPRHLSIRA